jgi:predicted small metal-binding protein
MSSHIRTGKIEFGDRKPGLQSALDQQAQHRSARFELEDREIAVACAPLQGIPSPNVSAPLAFLPACATLTPMRVADCDTPGCTYRMEGRNDEELFRSIRRHVDTVHPQEKFADDELMEWMTTAAYTVDEPSESSHG